MPKTPPGPRATKSSGAHRVTVQVDEDYAGDVDQKLLRDTARAALMHQVAAAGALTIAVSGDDTLKDLNLKYLGQNAPTDVLSFPSDDDDPEAEGRYFGDIAISFPRAYEQAWAGGHSVESELQLLVVHGVLHLLGHDHVYANDKSRMWQAQAEILNALGCEISGPAGA